MPASVIGTAVFSDVVVRDCAAERVSSTDVVVNDSEGVPVAGSVDVLGVIFVLEISASVVGIVALREAVVIDGAIVVIDGVVVVIDGAGVDSRLEVDKIITLVVGSVDVPSEVAA